MILYHMIAFFIGIILDLLIGDPYRLPHPIRLIGRWIGYLDKKALPKEIRSRNDGQTDSIKIERNEEEERKKGRKIVLTVTITVFLVTACILAGAYLISVYLGIAVEAVLMFYTLAAKSLKTESMKVYYALQTGNVELARYAVSMIVGRDTDVLDAEGITKAAVETVAENASDGVIAPMLYCFIGGPVLGMTYKAVNTMDSMLGYKNNRYLNLGRAAAKLDDAVNFVPARISAWLLIFGTWILERFSPETFRKEEGDGESGQVSVYNAKNAVRIFYRDRFNHKSPNSAQTESAAAGALQIQLAGDAVYFGETVKKPTIGDPIRPIETADIRRANKLMYAAFITGGAGCLILLAIIQLIL